MSTDPQARAWVEVRPGALRRNLRRIRESVGDAAAVIPMVKADGYGLGMEDVVRTLESEDPWGFGVATVEEGLRLRGAGVTIPVIIFNPVPPGSYDSAVAHDLTLTVSDLDSVERVAAAATRTGQVGRFQVEIDTGMGRSGFDWRRVAEWGPGLVDRTSSTSIWEGCYTHFHSADLVDDAPTRTQWENFNAALERLEPEKGSLIHACNAAAAMRYPTFAADAVRPGIFLYGGSIGEGVAPPEEVVRVRARVTLIRDVPQSTTLGYGATYRSSGNERWATLGIGYGDGFPRVLGNRGSALLAGQRLPIIGRISMDMTVVDITGAGGVRVGDVATLIGRDGDGVIPLDEIADLAGTISYEILTGFTARMPRIWMTE
ncbi:MAG: alanine racemase [Gemmatimonadetes bacterium]|nr:alanine racemase [Gemmatimonadota bacterium]